MIGWAGVSDNPPRIAQHVVRARGRSPGLSPHSLIARARGRLSPEDGSSLRSPSFHLASFVPSAFLTVAPAAAQGQANRQRLTRVWRCGDAKATAESGCHLLPQLSPSFAQPAASLARFCVVSQVRSCLTITLRRPFFFWTHQPPQHHQALSRSAESQSQSFAFGIIRPETRPLTSAHRRHVACIVFESARVKLRHRHRQQTPGSWFRLSKWQHAPQHYSRRLSAKIHCCLRCAYSACTATVHLQVWRCCCRAICPSVTVEHTNFLQAYSGSTTHASRGGTTSHALNSIITP